MGKLDKLENKLEKVVKKASLKNNNEKKTKNILIYNIPAEWTNILKENGISFSSYAKMAILEKMKKDGII
jgi:hypothetical protein